MGDTSPLFRLSLGMLGLEPDRRRWVSALAATTDFRLVLVNRSGSGDDQEPPPMLLRLTATSGD